MKIRTTYHLPFIINYVLKYVTHRQKFTVPYIHMYFVKTIEVLVIFMYVECALRGYLPFNLSSICKSGVPMYLRTGLEKILIKMRFYVI